MHWWRYINVDIVVLSGFSNLCLLNLNYCTSITKLPDSLGQLIQVLWLGYCSKLKRLPQSIEQLKGLKCLDLVGCTNLRVLPDSISTLSKLEYLSTYNCISFTILPTSLRFSSRLDDVTIGGSTECQQISYNTCIGQAWTHLKRLHTSYDGLGSHLEYGAWKCLETLYLADNILTELPESFGQLVCLRYLSIECRRLQCLPKSLGNLRKLRYLTLFYLEDLKKLPKNLGVLSNLVDIEVSFCPIKRLPKSIGLLLQLLVLVIRKCKKLQKLPESIKQLKSLQEFRLDSCGSIVAMGALTTLQGLPLWGSTSITKLPTSLGDVSTLIVNNICCMCLVYGKCYRLCNGCLKDTTQVLEEDESGFLRACQDKLSGQIRLVWSYNYGR